MLILLFLGGLYVLQYLPVDSLFGYLLKPLWRAEAHLGERLRTFFQSYLFLTQVQAENKALKERLLALEQELTYYKEREVLYQRLEALYQIKFETKFPQVVAKIIYKGIDPYSEILVIDKGSREGLLPQMPVLAYVQGMGVGLVGQVVEVYRSWSKVILLTDPSFAVDVKILRTQDRAILKGKGEPTVTLEFLPLYSQAQRGDRVITSGQDLLFPQGLLVGEILEIKKDPQGLFKRAEVKPLIDIYNLDFVVVLLKIPEVSL